MIAAGVNISGTVWYINMLLNIVYESSCLFLVPFFAIIEFIHEFLVIFFLSENLKRSGVGGRIILKSVLSKYCGCVWTGFSG